MIEIIDFTNCKLSSRDLQYGGRAGEKRGIVYNNKYWFLKFPKTTNGMRNIKRLSYVTSPISEYIGSHIYQILGYDVHETILGVCYDGKRYKVVCACKDFIEDDSNELLIPYTSLRNDTNPLIMEKRDSSFSSASNIYEIIFQLNHNKILSKIENVSDRFWDVALIDMLINNNDRNEDNWGVIRYKKENIFKLAPIYDCGNCFYGKSDEEKIENLLNDNEKLLDSSMNGVTAYEDDEGKTVTIRNILDIIKTNKPDVLNKIYDKVMNKIEDIENFIFSIPNEYNDIDIISDNRKLYYLKTLKIRLNYIKDNYL